ncbi:MAG: type II secretion system F family protein, partial [Nitrospirae bacterium]
LKAGIPLLTALHDLSATTENRTLKEKISLIARSVEMGSSLSEAFSQHRDIFPDILIRLTSVGEETGRLDQSLREVSEHLQRMEALTGAIKRALIYPAFAITATIGAMIFWLVYVLPKLANLFQELQIKLPAITRAVMAVSRFITMNWYLFVLTPVLLFLLYKGLRRNYSFRLKTDKLKLSIPVFNLILTNRILAVFSEQMRLLLNAGIAIDRIFEITAEVIGNEYVRRAVLQTKDEVMAGSTIADALKAHPVFPPMLVRMVSVGEQTGGLDDQLGFLANFFIERLDDISQRLGKMIEPIVIAVLGLFFMVIIIALLIPVYDLVSNIGAMR